MEVYTYGTDERLKYCKALLEKKQHDFVNKVLLFPIPTTRDRVHIVGGQDKLSDIISEVRHGVALVGFRIPKAIAHAAAELGGTVVDTAEDDELTEENARLTAVGCIGSILSSGRRAPYHSRIGIVGCGRIGRWLIKYLLPFGAELTVFTSSEQKRYDFIRCGVGADSYEALSGGAGKPASLDILINTAPSRLISAEAVPSLVGVRVIELASGDNMPAGLEFEAMPSLPGRMYPESAGRALFDSVVRALFSAEDRRSV